jgi:glycosyltransferase involved in cell wall biosynthesis
MRVLFLNNSFYLRGGAERVLFEEMRLLKQAGHEVAVYSRANSKNEASEYQELFPPEIETERVAFNAKALSTVREIIYSVDARTGLRKVIERFKPDIAHAHNIYGRLSLSVLDELKARGVPTVMTLHDYKLICPSYLMLNHGKVCEKCKANRFYHAVATKCHKDSYLASMVYGFETWMGVFLKKHDQVSYFISPSLFLRNKVMEFGWDGDRVVHVRNFIDGSSVGFCDEPGRYLLYMGRLSREKGVRTLLAAMKGLSSATSLKIAGDGPERGELEDLARREDLDVEFAGHLAGSELASAVSGAMALIVPSECYENAPLSVLEAFAFGRPVIGARIGGIPEMIEDGTDGYLFEPGNASDLRKKIEQLLGESEGRQRGMGKAARTKIATLYNEQLHYEGLMEVYENALSRKSKGRKKPEGPPVSGPRADHALK